MIIGRSAFGQVSSSNAAFIGQTAYQGGLPNDPIFVFTASSGTILAEAPNGIAGCNYTWSQYNSITKQFDIPVLTENGVDQSSLSGISQGGYQVHIFLTDSVDTTFRAWAFFHKLSAKVLKSTDGKILDYKYTCDYLDLNSTVATDTLTYYNPVTGLIYKYNLLPIFSWSFSNDKDTKENAYSNQNYRIYAPPPYDTRYILKVTDNSGLQVVDTVLYESIQTKAEFSFLVKDRQDNAFRKLKELESAPLEVEFSNQSVNGAEYKWTFMKESVPGMKMPAPVITTDTATKPHYIYYLPHGYIATLYSTSAEGCIDSVSNVDSIKISPSRINVPNYIKLHGSENDSKFRIFRESSGTSGNGTGSSSNVDMFASIQFIHVLIFGRTGKLVYEYNGDINDWEGWDGKMKGTGFEVSEGAYYYVIEANGYDGVVYKGVKEVMTKDKNDKSIPTRYTGFFYVFK